MRTCGPRYVGGSYWRSDRRRRQHSGGAGDLVRAVWRRKWLPPLCLVLIVGPTAVYLWKFQQAQFAAQAKVLLDIKTRPSRVLGAPELGGPFNLQTDAPAFRREFGSIIEQIN